MGGYVYILQSVKNGRYYIGSCTNMERRLAEHARGHTYSTRNRGPWILKYNEACITLAEAREKERAIKKWKSRKMIEKLIASQSTMTL